MHGYFTNKKPFFKGKSEKLTYKLFKVSGVLGNSGFC